MEIDDVHGASSHSRNSVTLESKKVEFTSLLLDTKK